MKHTAQVSQNRPVQSPLAAAPAAADGGGGGEMDDKYEEHNDYDYWLHVFIYICILTLATIHKLTTMKEGVST